MPSGFRNPFQGKFRQTESVAPDLFGEPDITVPMAVEFLKTCDSYQLQLFALLIFYGLRASEPCFLFRDNLTSDGWLKVVCLPQISYRTKGRRDKRLPLLEPIRILFEKQPRHTEAGLLLHRRSVWEGIEKSPLVSYSLDEITKEYTRRCRKSTNLSAEQGIQIRDQLLQEAGGLKYDHIENEFHRLADQLSWPAEATLKDFRHLFSTAMMNAGMPEYYRKYLMGHAVSKSAISTYTHLDQLREHYLEAAQRQFLPLIEVFTRRSNELVSAA
ncbi:tyrosine-type recombinase/integrase [Gimesia chilikensis]|nr:tyrosine-type recombinase/integrase [Gimesia chilikensis]